RGGSGHRSVRGADVRGPDQRGPLHRHGRGLITRPGTLRRTERNRATVPGPQNVPRPETTEQTSVHGRDDRLELVAEPADGDDVLRTGGALLDLGAQPLDVHVEGLGVTDVVGTPHAVDELHTG